MAVRLLCRKLPNLSRYDAVASPCVIVNRQMSRKKQPTQAKEKKKWVPRSVQAAKKNISVKPRNWEEFLQRKPEDDVWLKMYYPPQKYSFEEVVEMHRDLASPEMMNNMNGVLYFYAELNMRTSKVTKFISQFNGIVNVPHYFDDGVENKVLAFCKTKDEAREALAEGAAYAGGTDLMVLVESGEVRTYMFDHAVCTTNFIEDITKIRKHIRDKFPNKKYGGIGPNIAEIVKKFRYGKNYESSKPSDESGVIKVAVGTLDMPMEHLSENFRTFVDAINSHRSAQKTTKVGGPFMTKAYLYCPPSGERLHLKEEEVTSQPQTKKTVESPKETFDEAEQKQAAVA